MLYKKLVEIYEKLDRTTKRLEKTFIISEMLKSSTSEHTQKIVYLLQGMVFPQWDQRKLGMSSQLIVKVIATSTGNTTENVIKQWRKKGDLGLVAEELIRGTKQRTLTKKELTIEKVFENLQKLASLTGEGTVNRKVQLVAELLTNASPNEAKYITKTVLGELRVGTAEGVLRDAIAWAFFPKVIGIFYECENCKKLVPGDKKCINCEEKIEPKFEEEAEKHFKNALKIKEIQELKNLDKYEIIIPKDEGQAREAYNKIIKEIQKAYDMSNDFGMIASFLKEHGIKELTKIILKVGYPINSMLAIKAESIREGLETLGKPILAEQKIDGFRVQIHKQKEKIWLYTRRLENVTEQFKELIPYIKNNVKGETYILDSEIVGYNPKTGKYLPFQNISQRIKRKYDIEKVSKEIPVEINLFDVLYYEGENMMTKPQKERRKLLEKITKEAEKKIVLTKKLVSDNEREIEKFYEKSINMGFEGIMLKNLEKEYTPGRKVGGWLKIKPTLEPLDLVITGATYGEGKRSNVLSSYRLSCRLGDKFLECGMMGTGIKEKGEGTTFAKLTKMLKPLIISEHGREVNVKPEIVVEVAYEEVQKSPTYKSGFALRFPRLIRLRTEDKKAKEANTIEDLERIYLTQKRSKRR